MSAVVEPSIFGRIVTGGDVEERCIDVLKRWSGTYISEVERQNGIEAGTLARIRAWVTAPSFDKWPEDQVPAVLLISVGLAEAPRKGGDGRYRARWQMGLGCICSARTQAQAHAQAMLYVAAHRTLLIQRPSLDGWADGVVWQDEDYAQISYDDLRTLAAGQATFTVEVADVVTANAGPLTPDEPEDPDTLPWPPWQPVVTADVDVQNHQPPEPLP